MRNPSHDRKGVVFMRLFALAQVRHGTGRNGLKWFRVSSGDVRVYTTFAVECEVFREADAELLEEGFLLGRGFRDPSKTDFAAVRGRKHDVGALQTAK